MFETSIIHARAQVASGRFSLLTLSVIAHSAVIIGAIAFSIASVDFPTAAPDAYEKAPDFMVASVPPPLGRPDGGRQPEAQQPKQVPTPPPAQLTAPTQISETPITNADLPINNDTTGRVGDQPGQIGVEDGDPNSISTDSNPFPVVTSTAPIVEQIFQPYEVTAPKLLRRVDPTYPQIFMRAGLTSTVILRCVIDKNGHVVDPEIKVSGKTPFDDAVIAAVRQWRYTPASKNGVAVSSYLDVTVHFSVRR